MSEQIIDTFINKLMEQADLNDVPEDKREEYRQNIQGLIQQKLGMELMKKLPETAVDEFLRMIEKDTPTEKVSSFLQEKIPNFNEEVANVLQGFEKDFAFTLEQFASFAPKQ